MTGSVADVERQLSIAFGGGRVRVQLPLAPFTTFRVGGPAEYMFEARTSDEIAAALTLAHRAGAPVTMLGGGSNVLVADAGARDLGRLAQYMQRATQ